MMRQRFYKWIIFTALSILPAIPCAVSANSDQTEVKLPIPRFVALNFHEVNTRSGPGERYPIRWVYKRKHLPVEVIEEFDQWRKIRDAQGEEGWVHKTQLTGVRTALFMQDSFIRQNPDATTHPLAKIQSQVQGEIQECNASWCYIKLENYKGWIEKQVLFGVYPAEIIKD